MAKINGKQDDYTAVDVDNITKEQIIALAKYTQLLQEENQNLKGYITQLQAQLNNARGQRAVAEHNLQQHQQKIINIKTAFDE
jgi:hypothetical protein